MYDIRFQETADNRAQRFQGNSVQRAPYYHGTHWGRYNYPVN